MVAVLGHVAPRNHRMRGVVVDREQTARKVEAPIEAAQLRGERQRISRVGDEERLDPESVAAENHPAPAAVVDSEGPHPDQMFLDVFGVGLVQPQNDLGIAARAESNAADARDPGGAPARCRPRRCRR